MRTLGPRKMNRGIPLLCFLAIAVLGLTVVDDFGVTFDEAIQRRHGRVSIDYAAGKLGVERPALEPDYNLEDYQWANYGMIYQLVASGLELRLGYEESPFAYYRLRHVMNWLLYLLALVCFYRTLRWRWPHHRWYPLLGTAVFLLSPRILGHAFFNPKDHILLVAYVIATFTLVRYLRTRTTSALCWHVLATALALNTRLPALLIVGATVLILLAEQLRVSSDYRRLMIVPLYVIGSFALMIPFFPYLWEDTLPRLLAAFTEMSDFDWGGTNLLFGDLLVAKDVPAYYIPAWILITTPLLFLLFILTGLGRTLVETVKALAGMKLWRDDLQQIDFVQLGLSVGPILVVIVLHSTLYNGWRHLHFAYPGLAFLAMTGYHQLAGRWSRLAPVLLGLGLLTTAVSVVRYHPQQQTYFNVLVWGDPVLERFDMDYWGAGFREGFTELAARIPEGTVRAVRCQDWPCKDNLRALPPGVREKLRLEQDWGKADYVATNYLFPSERSQVKNREDFFARPVVEIRPAGQLILGIYAIKASE